MYQSLKEICRISEETGHSFWEVVLENDMQERMVTKEGSMQEMRAMYQAMKDADAGYDASLMSHSGLVGKDGERLSAARKEGRILCGDFIGSVMEKAVKMGESNACMKRIVAAPTAGSCGVVPAVFISMQEHMSLSDDEMIQAMYVAAGIGGVIASRAFLAGASGGCQAEIGSASAMAAGGAAYLRGGSNTEIISAAALALKGLLGLACDPVGGLVEVPCVKRNVIGAVNALTSADMAMAGIVSKIPPDQVIDAMKSIGQSLPPAIRETGSGGLAATPEGEALRERL